MEVLDACSELIHSFSPSPECCLDKSQKKMGVLNFFAKRQEILSSNGFLSVERSFLYTHPNTRDPSQVQSKRPFAYEKGILWPFRWQQNSLAPVEICRLAPIQPEVITWNIHTAQAKKTADLPTQSKDLLCQKQYIGKNWQASEICEPQLPEKQCLPPKSMKKTQIFTLDRSSI